MSARGLVAIVAAGEQECAQEREGGGVRVFHAVMILGASERRQRSGVSRVAVRCASAGAGTLCAISCEGGALGRVLRGHSDGTDRR